MFFEMFLMVALVVLGAVSSVVFYKLGFHFGEQDAINRLLDAKDPEAWDKAHYLRADKKSEAAERTTPATAFAAQKSADQATTQVIRKKLQ